MTSETAAPSIAVTGAPRPAKHVGEPLLLELLRWGLALVLVSSGVEKLAEPMAFYESLLGYRLWSPSLAMILTSVLPWAEVVIGAGLVLPGLRMGAALLTVGLGVAFVVVHGWMWRSGLEVDCGYGGVISVVGPGTTGAGAFAWAAGFLLAACVCFVGWLWWQCARRV